MRFSRDVRLGDLLNVAVVTIAIVGGWFKMDGRVTRLEEVTVKQEVSVKEFQSDVKQEFREQRALLMRVDDKIERIRK